jgi:hypothetical protein
MATVSRERTVKENRCDGVSNSCRVILTRYDILRGKADGALRGTPSAGELFEILHGKEVRVALIHSEEILRSLDAISVVVVVVVVVVIIEYDSLKTGHGRDRFQSRHLGGCLRSGSASLSSIKNGTTVLHKAERRSLSTLNFNNGGSSGDLVAGSKQTNAEGNILRSSALGLALHIVVLGLD